jgi:hypothetical protein
VPHLDLGDGDTHVAGDGGDEAVELAVEVDALDNLFTESLQRAAVIMEFDSRDAGDESVGQQGRQPAR